MENQKWQTELVLRRGPQKQKFCMEALKRLKCIQSGQEMVWEENQNMINTATFHEAATGKDGPSPPTNAAHT